MIGRLLISTNTSLSPRSGTMPVTLKIFCLPELPCTNATLFSPRHCASEMLEVCVVSLLSLRTNYAGWTARSAKWGHLSLATAAGGLQSSQTSQSIKTRTANYPLGPFLPLFCCVLPAVGRRGDLTDPPPRLNRLKGDLEPDLNLYAWDAALRTSAAPTYFPVHRCWVPLLPPRTSQCRGSECLRKRGGSRASAATTCLPVHSSEPPRHALCCRLP